MLQMLLGAGADVNSRAYLGATPFEYAFLTRDREMVRLFLKAKANPFLQPSAGGRLEIRPLVSAIARGDREMVNLFWEFIDDFVIQEEVGAMAFGAACETGQEDIVELLLTRISVQVKTKDGLTPLYYAVLYRNSAIVALLLDRDPDLDAQTVEGLVALDVAVFDGDQEITRMLLEAGASTEPIRLKGVGPLYIASAKGDEAIVKLLLEWNANTLAVDGEKRTALHMAAQLGHLRIVDLLLDKNQNAVGIKDAMGHLPLHLASFSGHSEIVSTLLANMGTTNIQPHEATVSDSEAQLESPKLPTLDMTVDSKTDDGITALHLAAQEGHAEVVRILLEAGASASITTPQGETPLQLAVRNGMLQSKDVSPPVNETVSLLLPASVDSSDPGAVALHLATLFQRDISEEPAESRISEQDAASEDVSVQEQSDTTAAEDV
jgi:ankyrin repeat protein